MSLFNIARNMRKASEAEEQTMRGFISHIGDDGTLIIIVQGRGHTAKPQSDEEWKLGQMVWVSKNKNGNLIVTGSMR